MSSEPRPWFTLKQGVNWLVVWENTLFDEQIEKDDLSFARAVQEAKGRMRAAEAEAWFEDFRARHGLK